MAGVVGIRKLELQSMIKYLFVIAILSLGSCATKEETSPDIYVMVLGVAQDGGYPQAGCEKKCCEKYWKGKAKGKSPVCLGIVDKTNGKIWLIEATPDFTKQWQNIKTCSGMIDKKAPDGIFLTHAHIGHYTGLINLGREAMGSDKVPVYLMPRFKTYLETNGPWDQLVTLKNVHLNLLKEDSTILLTDKIKVIPFVVPHRDEYSETVGYRIEITGRKFLFIPDIDKWEHWNRSIIDEIKKVDIAFLDATFFANGELNRDMSEIPHPFISESVEKFKGLQEKEKRKIHFIHFNHTNPILWDKGHRKQITDRHFAIAEEGRCY